MCLCKFTKHAVEGLMSKLNAVIRHEYFTIVKQPSFWITMIAIPVLMAVIGLLVYFGNSSSEAHIKQTAESMKTIAIIDESGLVNKNIVQGAGLSLSPSSQLNTLKEEVRKGTRDALVVYPENLASARKYTLYLSSNDITKMSSATSLADTLLKTSLFLPLGSADVIALAESGASSDVVMYKDGAVSGGFNDFIAPGLFVILFYIVFAFSISYMLTSVSEEKENRSMEMVLTYVKPRTLILGKLLAVSLVTLTQIAFFALLGLAVLGVMQHLGTAISLPLGIDIAKITFHPLTMFFGAAYLIVGFLMYAGFMTATAAAAPSAKEANSFSSVFFLGAFVPFYFITLIVTDPNNPIVHFVTFFPLTSPIVALVRNAVGNIGVVESLAALAVMAFFMVVSIWVAVRAFRLGALEYSQTIKLSSLFKKSSS